MDDFSNMNFQGTSDPLRFGVTVPASKVRKMTRYMKFVAVMDIIGGVLSCLNGSIISGLFVLFAGLRLKSAGDKLQVALNGAPFMNGEAVGEDIMEYFKKAGIAILVNIIATVIAVLMMIAIGQTLQTVINWG